MDITVHTVVNASPERTWEFWTLPEHVRKWNNAAPGWHTPCAVSDLRPGGRFDYRMEAKDGSVGFNFTGVFDEVRPPGVLAYILGDGRKVRVTFIARGSRTEVWETFEAESANSPKLQRQGWQAILDNFKIYIEGSKN